MHILILNQFFWPDSAATSQFATDLARHLAAQGHTITAICGSSGYAQTGDSTPPDVRIERLPELPFRRSLAMRSLSYVTFFLAAVYRSLCIEKPDLVITLTTPPLVSLIGTLLKKTKGVRHFIWEMDLYPDVAVDLGYLRPGSLLTWAFGVAADYCRRHSDGILALGPCMHDRLLARGIPEEKIHIAENWADSREITPLLPASYSPLTLLYSGNLGLAHDTETMLAAIGHFQSDGRFRFLFAGGGPRLAEFERSCRSLSAPFVSFRSYCARDQLSRSLAEGDIGLVFQRNECTGSVVPSKTYGILAAGRPILFIGPRQATPACIIERFRCGWQIDCGDATGLIALLENLAAHPSLVHDAGVRARRAFEEHYDLPIALARIARILGLAPAREIEAFPTNLVPKFGEME
jgi:glycosyltransferase involved in cell wall biosynthesis